MYRCKTKQSGLTTVEFSIIGVVFFMVLLAVIEFGRGLFVWNALNEVTRRAARLAAVCPINHGAITRVAVFDEASGDGKSPIVAGLSADDLTITYLDAQGNAVGDPTGNFTDIRYVRGSITGYRHAFLIPFVTGALAVDAPPFETTIPRESLGIPREGANPICFGSAT